MTRPDRSPRSRRRLRVATGAGAAALALGATIAFGPWAWSDPAAAAAADRPDLRTVTLITGDRVTIDLNDPRTAPRIDGRDGVTFVVERYQGELRVVPSDARDLIRSGVLDRRLFDVALLVRDGHDDATRSSIPLLTKTSDMSPSAAADGGATVTATMPSLDVVAVDQPKSETDALWSSLTAGDAGTFSAGVERVWLDGKREILLDHSVGQIGAPDAWEAGLTGDGVTVAVLDTGVDAEHPDLVDRIGATEDFTGTGMTDTIGHGTHVASTIAGSGAGSDGLYTGVAPDANLIIGKVCMDEGCDESAILAGMEWAAKQGADVANLSLGGWDTPETDPLEQAVEDLTARYDTLFVIAAGNDGDDETVGSPSSAPSALSVGAVDDEDSLAEFSSRGPRIADGGLKPEITAPGVDIVAAQASGTEMGAPVADGYIAASGTSMATPHVAGAAAILAQQHPDWSALEVKAALMASSTANPELSAYEQGAGRVDVTRAVGQTVLAEPASVSAGLVEWPHDVDPTTTTVALRNSGDTDLSLDVSVTTTGPDGTAPDGLFAVDADTVAIPAGGSTTIDVVVDPRAAASAVGYFTAHVTATDGTTSLTVPVGVVLEQEKHTLSVEAIGFQGVPAEAEFSIIGFDGETWEEIVYTPEDGGEMRLPEGVYQVNAWIVDEETGEFAMLTFPNVELTGDAAISADAADAAPIEITVPNKRAEPTGGIVAANRRIGDTVYSSLIFLDDLADLHTGLVDGEADATMNTVIAGGWAPPTGDASANGTGSIPQTFTLAYDLPGYPTGFEKKVKRSELAKVITTYPAIGDHHTMGSWMATLPGGDGVGMGTVVAAGTKTHEYVNSTEGITWSQSFEVVDVDTFDTIARQSSNRTVFEAGETYRTTWMQGVLGPCASGVDRFDGELVAYSSQFCDSAPDHAGDVLADTAATRLYFDGELIAESDEPGFGWFDVAQEGEFRLEMTTEQSVLPTSTRVSSEWTFEAANPTGEPVTTPLTTVRFLADTTQPADSATEIDLLIASGDEPAPAEDLVVEVSFDDGETWTEVAVDDGSIVVDNPGDGFVSLRATGVGEGGDTFSHTVVRAYAVS